MDRLKGKVAVITGGALGLGRATALRMAEEGASVAVCDILIHEANAVVDELVGRGFDACCWQLDVSREADVERVLGEVARRFGRIDILVNNAGVAGANKPTDQLTEAEWDFVQGVNVKGVFFGTKHAIPHLRRAGGGAIVNTASIAGLFGDYGLLAYNAAKGGVVNLSRALAIDHARESIRANAVCPGPIETPLAKGLVEHPAVSAEYAKLIPMGRIGRAEEVAAAVAFLASDDAAYITGQTVNVDGGLIMS